MKQKNLVENFQLRMSQTFLITDKNAEELIVKDRLRNDQQKKEDLAFLKSMKEDRKASVSTADTQYQMKVDSKIKRQEMEQNRLVDEQARRTPQTQESVSQEVVEASSGEDYLIRYKSELKKEKRKICYN